MFLVVRNKAVILSWAGGGQSSPPIQLWNDEEEEEEEEEGQHARTVWGTPVPDFGVWKAGLEL